MAHNTHMRIRALIQNKRMFSTNIKVDILVGLYNKFME